MNPFRNINAFKASKGLGIFSIGLGLFEMFATKSVARAVNMPKKAGLLRACGVREMATGLGLLSQKRRSPWLWARVAGDVVDMAALGTAFAATRRHRGRVAAALAAVAGVTALDIFCGRKLSSAVVSAMQPLYPLERFRPMEGI